MSALPVELEPKVAASSLRKQARRRLASSPSGDAKAMWTDVLRLCDVFDASMQLLEAERDNAAAEPSSWTEARAALDNARHDWLIALGECDLCEPRTCPGAAK